MQPKKHKHTLPLLLRRIHGHSMLPVLPPRTYVWGNKWFRKLKIGDTIIFRHDDKEKIKRIADMRDDELYVLGDNPAGSSDSRRFGWIHQDTVIAKVFWPHAPKDRAEDVGA